MTSTEPTDIQDLFERVALLSPAPGDVVVMKTSHVLTREQRAKCRENFGSVFAKFGCRFLLLDGGVDIELLAVGDPAVSPATEPATFATGAIHEVEAHTAASACLGSIAIDPLESAIRETVGLLNEHAVFLAESGLNEVQKAGLRFLGEKLNSHLNHLLASQLDAVRKREAQSMEGAAQQVLRKLVQLGRMSTNDYRNALREVCE